MVDIEKDNEVRNLVCELSRSFYHLGWAIGTGGSLGIRHGDHLVLTPSGLHKERLTPHDLFTVDLTGNIIQPSSNNRKLSDSTPLYLHIFQAAGAGESSSSHIQSLLV